MGGKGLDISSVRIRKRKTTEITIKAAGPRSMCNVPEVSLELLTVVVTKVQMVRMIHTSLFSYPALYFQLLCSAHGGGSTYTQTFTKLVN